MQTIKTKTIMSKTRNSSWFGCEYNMNIYRGCPHGCIYCDSRSDCYKNPDFDTVKIKEDALEILRNELRKKLKQGVVATGSMSDPYNPFEEKLLLTRHSLELLSAYGFGAAIATKSTLVTRDVDILSEIKRQSPVLVKITITTTDDGLSKKIEPGAPASSQRFEALKKLADNGIYCGVLLMPVLPFITGEINNIRNIIIKSAHCGAKFIYPGMGVTLRDTQRQHFYNMLNQNFPGLEEKYKKVFGNTYSCGIPNYKRIFSEFQNECNKIGMLYKMQDIIRGYKSGYSQEQINHFN